MQDRICDLIINYKNGVDREKNILSIVDRFMPLIIKNAKQLSYMEFDDVKQELIIAVILAVEKIETYECEGKCVNFIAIAIRNRYLELYRDAKKIKEHQISMDELYHENDNCHQNSFEEVELLIDVKRKQKEWGILKYKIILGVLLLHMSDKEIAEKLNVSRQYVNRCKKEILKKMKYN